MEPNSNSVALAPTNGQLTSPQPNSDSPLVLTPGKRKRVSSPGQEASNGDESSNPSNTSKTESLNQTLKDLLQVLEKYDSDLGILKFPLPQKSSVEPESKRAKLSDAVDNSQTIESKITRGQYTAIQEVVDDVETASVLVVERRREPEATADRPSNSRSPTDLVNLSRIFKKHLDNFILRSPFQGSSLVKNESQEFQRSESQNKESNGKAYDREDRMVLTLFGNAPRGRHLFSSLQHPVTVTSDSRGIDKSISAGVRATLNDATLPNGISTSKVIPFNVKNVEPGNEKARTVSDVFPPRPTLPQLQPPRKTRSSKDSSVTWLDPYEIILATKYPANERRGYSYLPLPSGHWLHYGYEPSVRPGNRRQRSDNDAGKKIQKPFQNPLDDGNSTFRGVYSSFAPSFDSSGSVIPEDAKEQIWWDKFGVNSFHKLFSTEDDVEPQQTETQGGPPQLQPLDDADLEEAVKSYKPEVDKNLAEEVESTNGTNDDKDLEEVLENISDLIRTLNSYRQIRSLGLPNPSSPGQPSDEVAGSPDASSPSATEFTVYETLKSSLSAMIATLPPYAVSKLDGDQLAELNVSKKILLESADYPGTMEEDEYTIQQKQMARVPQMPNAARTPAPNMNPSRTSPYQTPTAAPNIPLQRGGYSSNSRAKPLPMNHPPHQPYGARQPSTSIHYPPSNSPQPYNPARQPPPQRPGYAQPQFPQPGAPPYSQGNILQQFQRPTQNGIGPYSSQRMASPAQASPQPYSHRPNPPPYQQQTQNSPYGSPAAGPHNASPQRHPSFGASPQRHPYMNSTPGSTQPQPRYFQQQTPQTTHFPNFPPNQASPAPAGYSNSAAAMTYARSAAEQAALMDRNKAQLAEHQRQKSGTPQPASSNGQFGVQGNLPPSNRQNGPSIGATAGPTQ